MWSPRQRYEPDCSPQSSSKPNYRMRRYIYPLYDYNGKYFAVEHIYMFLRE